MPALKEIRDVFAPILTEHPDLVLRRRWLFKPPIETAAIALHVGPTSSAKDVDLALTVVPLSRFIHPSALGYRRSILIERVIGAPPPEHWMPLRLQDPPSAYFDVFSPGYQQHLLPNFEAKVRPFLDAVRTFDDVVAWITRFRELPRRMGPVEHIDGWIAAMQGDFAAAARHLRSYIDRMEAVHRGVMDTYWTLQTDIARTLEGADPTAIAAFLHDLERRTITAYGLERFWRPTPFPFERA